MKNLPWYDDDLSDEEQSTAAALTQLLSVNQTLANRVASLAWLRDGVNTDESQAVIQLERLASIDTRAATDVGVLPWFNDDVKEHEWRAIQHLQTIVKHDPLLLDAFKRKLWFFETITVEDAERLENLSRIVDPQGNGSGIGVGVASKIVQLGWFIREISGDYQNQLLGELAVLMAWDLELGARVAEMPFMADSIESHDVGLIQTLNELSGDSVTTLTGQPWFKDGVDDDDAIVATILPSQEFRSPENFRRLLNASFVEKGSTFLPLTGNVSFAIVRVGSVGNGEVMPHLIEAARHIEDFMGMPQPIDEVILLIGAPGGQRELSGVNLGGSFIVVTPDADICCIENETTFAHELIHFYPANRGRVTPPWFREGGADYLSFVVQERLYNLVFQRSLDSCPAGSIQELLDHEATVGPAQHQLSTNFVCNYSMGERLFRAIEDALGSAAFIKAWQEIQQTAGEGPFATDAKIYEIFRRHTTSDRLQLLEAAYAIWHRGDFDN